MDGNIINILIPIETASRELTYKTFLSHHLALNGYNCYLGSKNNIFYLLKKFDNYIYLDKGYHKNVSERIYKLIKRSNGIIISLDEEGAVDYNNNSTILGRYAPELFRNVDFTFFWGIKQYETVKSHMQKKSKFLITGHPRFELLKPEYLNIYKQEVDTIKQKYNNFILINTNMSFGNNTKGDDFVRSNYIDRFKNVDQIINFDKKKLNSYKSLILNLAQKEKKIIVRPHPEEDESFYKEAFKDYENIYVIYEGSVIPWLLSSDIMIHPDCTTALEYLFIGKRPISYLPKNYPEDLATKLPIHSSICFTNEDKLIKYINNNSELNDQSEKNKYLLLEEYFSYSKPTTGLIVNQINKLFDSYNHSLQNELSFYLKISLIIKSLKNKVSINLPSKKLYKNKLKGLSYNAIKNIRRNLCESNYEFDKVKLKKLNNNVFRISYRNTKLS